MAGYLVWLAEVLVAAGLAVVEAPGWRTRGRGAMGAVRGVMLHHTANPNPGAMPSLAMLIAGRPDLAGPLCHLALGRDGTFHVVAAGRANHAGVGSWAGITTGNASFIGIEAENGGGAHDAWPAVQLAAYRRGVAALLGHVGASAAMCCGHREYAPGRKIDPRFDMAAFRGDVAALLGELPGSAMPRRPSLPAAAPGRAATVDIAAAASI